MNDLQLEKKIRQDTAKVRKDLKTLADDSSARLSDPDMMKMARTKVAPVSRNNSSTNFDRLPADVFLFDG